MEAQIIEIRDVMEALGITVSDCLQRLYPHENTNYVIGVYFDDDPERSAIVADTHSPERVIEALRGIADKYERDLEDTNGQ